MYSYLIEDHIYEIKCRLYYVLTCFVGIFITAYIYVYEILYLLSAGFIKSLFFTDITESFSSQLELSFYTSIVLTVPYLLLNIWLFLKPGLYVSEARKLKLLFISTISLYLLSIYLVVYIIIPTAMNFFIKFQYLDPSLNMQIEYLPRMVKFLSFSYKIFLAFLTVMQLPTLLFILFYYKIINVEHMTKYRRYFIFFSFLLATILSPPDLGTQLLIAIPLICFYELTIFCIFFYEKMFHKKGHY